MGRTTWIAAGLAVVVVAGAVGLVLAAADDGPDEEVTTIGSADATAGDTDPGSDGSPSTTPTTTTVTVPQIPGDPPDAGSVSALEDTEHAGFPQPLVDPSEIRSGGPPPDGIPPIDDPRFEPARSVDWLAENEPVLVLEVDGEARAYPIQIMTWHELVNDTFGELPVTVSYCPLCNSAIAYVRATADGRVLDFGTSGRLLNSSLVMYDRQTESLWSHFTATAVVGTLTGTTVETLPVTTVAWSEFRDTHPDGLVLSRDTGFRRDYGRNPYPGYDDVDSSPFLFDGPVDGRLPAQTRVLVLRGATETIAVPTEELAEVGVVETTLDGDPVVLVHRPGTASALDAGTVAGGRDVGAVAAFRGETAAGPLLLERDAEGELVDATTGAAYDLLGNPLDDPDAPRLEPVEHLDTFWFAIAAFEPDTRVLTP